MSYFLQNSQSTIPVEGINGAGWDLIPGLIDHNAKQAFTNGQCHALALALHQQTKWPLIWTTFQTCNHRLCSQDQDAYCHPDHVLVKTPKETYLDILGEHSLESLQKIYKEVGSLSTSRLEHLISIEHFIEPDHQAANTFVDAVLALYHP